MPTARCDTNREIVRINKLLQQNRARIRKLENWLKEEAANIASPTLSGVITGILERRERSGLTNLKDASKILVFLQTNNITDAAGLDKKLYSMNAQNRKLHEELKPIERRLHTLDEHIEQAEYFKEFRAINAEYNKLYDEYLAFEKSKKFGAKRKAEKALEKANTYYDANSREIILFQSAERYLKDVLQDHYNPKKLPPITKWKEERAAKTVRKNAIYNESNTLRDDILKVEQVKRGIEELI